MTPTFKPTCSTCRGRCSIPCEHCDCAPDLLTFAFPVRYIIAYLTADSLLLLAIACAKTKDATPTAAASRDNNLALGNSGGAVASTNGPINYLLLKDQYTLSYDRN